MKRYIKPNTEVQQIELVLMQAASGLKQIDPSQKVTDVSEIDARGNDFSLWDDSEEEE